MEFDRFMGPTGVRDADQKCEGGGGFHNLKLGVGFPCPNFPDVGAGGEGRGGAISVQE